MILFHDMFSLESYNLDALIVLKKGGKDGFAAVCGRGIEMS